MGVQSVDPDDVESTLPLGSVMLRSGDPASMIPGFPDSNPVSASSTLSSLANSSSLFLPDSRIILFCDSVNPRVFQWPLATLFSYFLCLLRCFLLCLFVFMHIVCSLDLRSQNNTMTYSY